MTSRRNAKTEKLEIEFVSSGFCISFRLNVADEELIKGICQNIINTNRHVKEKLNSRHISLCGLWNAFTENYAPHKVESVGYDFKSLFVNPMSNYADSGGLQQARRGEKFSEETKRDIYLHQTLYSDYAFAFDEIPYRQKNGQMVYLGNNAAEQCGSQAGKNLKEHIKYFNKKNADTKIFPIVQGPTPTYTLAMFGELTKKQLKLMDQIAIGGVIWVNEFEILERAVNLYTIMDGISPHMLGHLHLLGVTGFRKLLPTLIGARNGLLPGIKKLSFDSTSLMRSYSRGFVHPSISDIRAGKPYTLLGKVRTNSVENYYEELYNFFQNLPNNIFESVEDLLEHSCFNSQGLTTETQIYNELGLEAGIKAVSQTIYYVQYNTFKFLQILQMYVEKNIPLAEFMYKYRDLHHLQSLETINCASDFQCWFDDSMRAMVIDSNKRRDPLSGIKATSFLF